MTRRCGVPGLLGTAVILAACQSTVTPTPSDIAACRPEEIRMEAGSAEGRGGGQIVAFVVVGTVGASRCRLPTATSGELRTPGGDPIAQATGEGPMHGGAPETIVLDPAAGPAQPDGARPGQGVVQIFLGNFCGIAPAATMTIGLPGTGNSLTVPLGRGVVCEVPFKPPSFFIGLVEAPG